MNVVPAQIAGVRRIVVATPPTSANPAVAYALQRLGITEVLGVGGAQAIAALAYGTESVAPVDKIVGPGNAYVAAAKRQVFGQVGIDAIAGPSEVVILADDSAPPAWIALDLLAQAEHDPDARVTLVTTSSALAQAVSQALQQALANTPRREIAQSAITAHAANIVVANFALGVALVNRMAPEHLQIMLSEGLGASPSDFVAGAIFWGPCSPTAVGDYWAGPNHVLPTGRTARFRGPLGVDDFLVPTSVITYTAAAAATLDPARQLAVAESLPAHAASLAARLPTGQEGPDSP
jgi:histidinol dehydrogenase